MSVQPVRVVIALGSNLEDRRELLRSGRAAIGRIPGVTIVASTSVDETSPIGPPQPMYLNQMVLVETTRSLEALLVALQEIEHRHGRSRVVPKGPRTLDLDIVYSHEVRVTSAALLVPHPGLLDRPFWHRQLAALIGAEAAEMAIAAAQVHAGMDTAGIVDAPSRPRGTGRTETVA